MIEGALRVVVLADLLDGHPAKREEDSAALLGVRAHGGLDLFGDGLSVGSLK